MANSATATRMAIHPELGTTKLCMKDPHQLYAGTPCEANPFTPAPLLWRKAGFSAPHNFAVPACSHIMPSHTLIAVQPGANTLELCTKVRNFGVLTADGSPRRRRMLSMTLTPFWPSVDLATIMEYGRCSSIG